MRKIPVSSLASIALAVPLGIGGLTLTVPVTAADARANIAHHFGTCSVHVIWKCAQGYRNLIFNDFRDLFSNSGWYERGANGADAKTFGALNWRRETNFEGTGDRSRQYLERAFSDNGVDPDFNHRFRGLGFIHPDDRAEYERLAEANPVGETGREAGEGENLYYRKLTAFKRECKAHVRSDETVSRTYTVYNEEQETERCIVRRTVDDTNFVFRYDFDPEAANLGLDFLGTEEVAFQITPIAPLGSLAEIEAIEDHQQATSDNRARIVELQGEVAGHEDRLQELEPVVERNVQVLEALGNSVGVLSEAVTSLAEDTGKNTAGIALAYALDAPGLSYGRRFAITGALGNFRGESAVGFSGTFKAGGHVLISVGGGFAGSGDSSVNGGKVSATYEW